MTKDRTQTVFFSRWWWHIVFICVLALLLRFPLLNGSFWLDEAAQALESTRPWWQQFALAEDFQPPFIHIVVHVLQYFSQSEWWLRVASLLPGIGSILLVMLGLQKATRSHKIALLAGTLLALSNIHIFFSQELRPYMWGVFWGVASWATYQFWQDSAAQNRKKWQTLFVLTNAFGLLSSYVFLFWWMAQWLLFVFQTPRRWWRVSSLFLVSSLFFMVWYPGFLEQWRVGQTLQASLPGWAEVVSTPFLKAIPLTLAKFLTGVKEVDISPFFAVTVGGWWVLLAAGVVWSWWETRIKNERLHKVLEQLVILVGSALLMAWLFTLLTPVLAPKLVLYIFPFILALVAAVFAVRRWLGTLLIIWFLLWQGVANWGYWTQPQLQRENWKSLVQEIETSFSPTNTAVLFGFEGPFAPWEWYASESWTTFATGTTPPDTYEAVERKLAGVQNYEYVLVFEYLRDLTDPERKIEFVLTEWGYEEVGAITYPNIGPVRMWVKEKLFAQRSTHAE